MRKIATFAFAAVLATAGSASASNTKCEGKIEKAGIKFASAVSKALQKCIDGAQKTLDGGDPISQGNADACEKAIDKINATRTKTMDGCLTAGCTNGELSAIGHLISGSNGPQGTGDSVAGIASGSMDFACTYVVAVAEATAIQNTLAQVGSGQTLMLAALGADAANTATDFETYITALPRCNTHACVLTSGSGMTTGSASLSLNFGGAATSLPLSIGGSVPLEICTPVGGGIGVGTDAKLIHSAPGRSVKPVTGLPMGLVACPTTIRAEGACDCGATVAWSKNYGLCRDSDLTDNGGVDDCAALPGYGDTGSAPDANGGDVYFSPAPTGMVVPTANGDCTGTLSVSFKVVSPLQVGADGIACTNDDTVAPGSAQALPFTTGTAQGRVLDAQNPGNNTTGEVDVIPGQVTGAAISACSSLESSNLNGLKLVGAAPVLDGGTSALGDNVITLSLTCN